MTVGTELIVWTAAALLVVVTVAFVGTQLLPSFLFHQPQSMNPRDGRSFVTRDRVFCRVQRADIDVDQCVGCPHLRVMDGGGSYIVCDSRAAAAITPEI